MPSLNKVVYTAHATATGGRAGKGKSSDGNLDVTLTTPKEMGGDGAPGTNPEQLFAVGYAACFLGAMKAVSKGVGVRVPAEASIDNAVSFGPIDHGYNVAVEMKISLPGLEKADAEKLVAEAHKVCPYSNATRGNVDVKFSIV